jgi:hypothetical protein
MVRHLRMLRWADFPDPPAIGAFRPLLSRLRSHDVRCLPRSTTTVVIPLCHNIHHGFLEPKPKLFYGSRPRQAAEGQVSSDSLPTSCDSCTSSVCHAAINLIATESPKHLLPQYFPRLRRAILRGRKWRKCRKCQPKFRITPTPISEQCLFTSRISDVHCSSFPSLTPANAVGTSEDRKIARSKSCKSLDCNSFSIS